MRRAQFDANVWVSGALRPGSVPAQVIDLARRGEVESVLSEALIGQVLRSLRRLGFPEHAVAAADAEMRAMCFVVEPTFRLSVITAKESDNRVLECAVAGRVDVIVTGDRKHLLKLERYEGIPLVSPADFLDLVRADE